MGTYLVIKNNIKRAIQNRTNLVLIVVIPIIICLLTVVSLQIKNNIIRIGILKTETTTQEQLDKVIKVLEDNPSVQVKVASQAYSNTNLIMNQYHMYINLANPVDEELESALQKVTKMQQSSGNTPVSEARQSVALLITTFLILGTVHASNYIKDKRNKLIERYQFSGNKKSTYFIAYGVYTWLIVAIQSALSLGLIQVLLPEARLTVMVFIEVILGLSLLASVLAMAITSISKNDMKANLCASSVAILLSLLAGTFVSTSNMPRFLQTLQVLNPIEWILRLLD